MASLDIARTIDHTLLKPEATGAQVDAIVAEALEHRFASVCVNGCFIERIAEALEGSPVAVCAVAGFPLGAMQPKAIAQEAADLVQRGATEIDFVAPLRHLLTGSAEDATEVMFRVVDAVRQANAGAHVKVILETAALLADVDQSVGEARIAQACAAAQKAGCDYVKTSTGFHPAGGASELAVSLLAKYANGMKVKASGGIRTRDDAIKMLEAGADRLGCSAGVAIVTQG